MINRGGPTLVVRIADETGAAPARIAAAFAAVRNSYDLIGLNTEIEALDNRIPGKLQLDLFAAVQDLLLDRIVWFLRNVDLGQGLAAVIDHYQAGIATVAASLDGALTEAARAARAARVAELAGAGVPDADRAPPRRPAVAQPGGRHRAGRRPRPACGRRRGGDLLCGRRLFPARPHRGGRAPRADRRLFRPPRARPRPRHDRRRRAPHRRRDDGERRAGQRRGRGLGRGAPRATSSACAWRCTRSPRRA